MSQNPEFDHLVHSYNQYMSRVKVEKTSLRDMKFFWEGFSSVIDFFKPNKIQHHHPIYGNRSLSPAQQDAVILASDWVRAGQDLDELVLSGAESIPGEDVTVGKDIIKHMYAYYKNVYEQNKK